MDSRPPPPPHGSNPTGGPSAGFNGASNANSKSSHLPPGNYDIFVIPPHSSGSGFLYLPSMQPHRNSFLAGVACTLMAVAVWATVIPAIKSWLSSVAASGGMAVLFLVLAVGVLGWAAGKTQSENTGTSNHAGSGGGNNQQQNHQNAHGSYGFTPGGSMPFGTGTSGAGAKPSWQQRAAPNGAGTSSWEKAREETRKREETRRKQEEAERDKAKAREREAREKAARERLAQERQRKENEAKVNATKEKENTKSKDSAKSDPPPAANTSRNYQKPTAQSYVGDDEDEDEYSYRPYDSPKPRNNPNSSYVSGSTYVPSDTTAPSPRRGPYANKDPDKIVIKAVYAFSDNFPKPIAQLVSGVGNVTDGLVLKMSTEGLFIDDDVRGVGQREWDVKAWSLKLFETGDLKGKHVLRASVRDAENKKYVFIIDAAESWKVAMGLQRLRRGSQVRSLGVSGLPTSETKALLVALGWLRE